MNPSEQLFVEPAEAELRLDQILTQRFQGQFSRTYFQRLIEEGCVLVNGEVVKKRFKPNPGDEIEIEFAADPVVDLNPEDIPLDILFEDDDLLVINKPAGMVVHPAPGNWTGTFVNALVHHCNALLATEDTVRPGIVHRLDKDTSGVLVAAKNAETQRKLIEMFANRQVYKEYLAITIGNPGNKRVEAPIGRHPTHRQKMAVVMKGKPAISHFELLKMKGAYALVKIILETGRTHQIRVHLSSLATPILGDSLYGNKSINAKEKENRQLLHAYKIRFTHPATKKTLEITAPPPEDFKSWMEKM